MHRIGDYGIEVEHIIGEFGLVDLHLIGDYGIETVQNGRLWDWRRAENKIRDWKYAQKDYRIEDMNRLGDFGIEDLLR